MSEAGFRDWKRYVTDDRWSEIYSDYQQRYVNNPRESDRKSAYLARLALLESGVRSARILDIGCSTGNFLRHLRRVIPAAALYGGDLMEKHLEECRSAPDLRDIEFTRMDILALPNGNPFDVIVANAVSVYFDKPEYELACRSICAALKPGGTFIGFELVFPGDKEQQFVEPSDAHPEGLKLELRSEDFVVAAFKKAGFAECTVSPFDIPIDLPPRESTQEEPDAHLYSRTERDPITNRRLLWRGPLFQPWAHICARRDSTS
jgi:SAM-dependent methyltransferase